jgi:glycerophosphoryl diester phosphodiesterase
MFKRLGVLSSAIAIVLSVAPMSPASGTSKIRVHSHRGARAMRPENTIPAFEYAIKAGVDAIEMDMAVTKDNVIVISHDPILHGPVCNGPQQSAVIHELTLAQVREWDCGAVQNPNFAKQQTIPGTEMPTLDEVLSLSREGDFEFNIETKSFRDSRSTRLLPRSSCGCFSTRCASITWRSA